MIYIHPDIFSRQDTSSSDLQSTKPPLSTHSFFANIRERFQRFHPRVQQTNAEKCKDFSKGMDSVLTNLKNDIDKIHEEYEIKNAQKEEDILNFLKKALEKK